MVEELKRGMSMWLVESKGKLTIAFHQEVQEEQPVVGLVSSPCGVNAKMGN